MLRVDGPRSRSTFSKSRSLPRGSAQRGSVLVIVLWITFGLISLSLYFANSMTFELRASDNRVAAQAAEQAIEGAVRYINYLLTTQIANGSNGWMLDPATYANRAVTIGSARFWLIGRDTNLVTSGPGHLCFGLVDEASKLNLNSLLDNANTFSNQLIWLPTMTLDLAQAILDWRDTNGTGSTVTYYAMQQPPYLCKNDPFETVDELRMVYGADMDVLIGEDANRNGVLDPNETDANQNNMLDPGVLEYVTVYSREPASSGAVNLRNLGSGAPGLYGLLQTNLPSGRADQIFTSLGLSPTGAAGGRTTTGAAGGRGGASGAAGGPGRTPAPAAPVSFTCPLQFYVRSGMSLTEFALIATNLTTTSNSTIDGRVNVNTASAAVLCCLLGGDSAAAQQVINYRLTNPNNLTSVAWVADALGQSFTDALAAIQAGDFLTTQSYQFTADVAALGPFGRGYRRVKFVFDTSTGTPQIIYRQDLTNLGWALGKEIRQNYVLANNDNRGRR